MPAWDIKAAQLLECVATVLTCSLPEGLNGSANQAYTAAGYAASAGEGYARSGMVAPARQAVAQSRLRCVCESGFTPPNLRIQSKIAEA